ncbi:MAG TPA: BON domain-containing protein [Syntrophorhabdaceae bacterium]|jgi:hyperosmotically inducible protein
MKRKNMLIHLLILLMFVAALAACGSTPKQESTGDYVDDSVITTKVKALLAKDDILKSFEISVETRKGVVLLSGWVDTRDSVNRAGQIARSVAGVQSVKNSLMVK